MIQVTVDKIGLDQNNDQAVILLGDLTRTTFIPIWVRGTEATSIALPIQGIKPPRPMTADLVVKILEQFDASVERVIVRELKDETFFASLILRAGGESLDIDCRPSDAIAIALRKEVPIFVDEKVMAEAGIAAEDSEIH